ncbi:hypothetical protein [Metabacillus fastidiosus]|uniref:hypothetical protein n=1 Tax=Metabacillus fastidiosus TaxID=1458 RepID=UPI003D2C76CC
MTQITMGMIKKDNQKYKEFVELPVPVGDKEYVVKIYPYFSPEKVRDLRNEYYQFLKTAEDEKVEIPEIERDDLIGYYVIKYFTDVKMTSSKKIKTIYAEFKEALNSPLFEVVLKGLPEESLLYVHEKIHEIKEIGARFENEIRKAQEEIQNLDLENRDVLFPPTEKQIPEV